MHAIRLESGCLVSKGPMPTSSCVTPLSHGISGPLHSPLESENNGASSRLVIKINSHQELIMLIPCMSKHSAHLAEELEEGYVQDDS